jgi:hypothetical protein
VAGGLGDLDQQRGEPAQDDVCADASFLAVIYRAQIDDLLEVASASLDFQEQVASQGDVFGDQPRSQRRNVDLSPR